MIVVSPEYRELLMDMLERGDLSDRMYDKLVNEEKEHFNQAVKASGLMETIKLKTHQRRQERFSGKIQSIKRSIHSR